MLEKQIKIWGDARSWWNTLARARTSFVVITCGSSPVWRGKVTGIPQCSRAKSNSHLNSDVEKGIFIYLPIVCFVLKLTNSCSVGGQWRRLGWLTCPFFMALIPGARCLVSPKAPFFPLKWERPLPPTHPPRRLWDQVWKAPCTSRGQVLAFLS